MMSNAEMKAVALKCFEADIKAEFKYLCSRKIVSIFIDRSPYNIVNKLTGQRMEEEISAKAPTFYKCLRAAANKDNSGKKQSLGTEKKKAKGCFIFLGSKCGCVIDVKESRSSSVSSELQNITTVLARSRKVGV